MAIIKNVVAGVAAASLLLTSTAYASETRADSFASPSSVQPVTLAKTSKQSTVKRSTAGYTDNSNGIAVAGGWLIPFLFITAAGAFSIVGWIKTTQNPSPVTGGAPFTVGN